MNAYRIFSCFVLILLLNISDIKCDVSIENIDVFPENENHELFATQDFKITIELKDDYGDKIPVVEDDALFNKVECIINGTMEIIKYVDINEGITCYVKNCYKSLPGISSIKIKYDDVEIKNYSINVQPGKIDPSKGGFYTLPDYIVGKEISHYGKFLDKFENTIKITDTSHFIYTNVSLIAPPGIDVNKYIIQSGERMEYKVIYTEANNYTLEVIFDNEGQNVILHTFSYYVQPDSQIDISKSELSLDTIILPSYNPILKISTVPKDKYGNLNGPFLTNSRVTAKLKQGSATVKTFSFHYLNSQNKYSINIGPLSMTAYNLYIELCDDFNRCQNTPTFIYMKY